MPRSVSIEANSNVPAFLQRIITQTRVSNQLPAHMKQHNNDQQRDHDHNPIQRDHASKRKRAELEDEGDIAPIVANLSDFDAADQQRVNDMIDKQRTKQHVKQDSDDASQAIVQHDIAVDTVIVNDVTNRSKSQRDEIDATNSHPIMSKSRPSQLSRSKPQHVTSTIRRPAPSLTFDDEDD